MKCENYVKLSFPALSRNESYARAAVGAFVSQLDPTLDELGSVKAAVSEAVTNCVVHAYSECETVGIINIIARIKEEDVYIKITDKGCGIEDIKKAMEPLFTTKPELERSGLGFARLWKAVATRSKYRQRWAKVQPLPLHSVLIKRC